MILIWYNVFKLNFYRNLIKLKVEIDYIENYLYYSSYKRINIKEDTFISLLKHWAVCKTNLRIFEIKVSFRTALIYKKKLNL